MPALRLSGSAGSSTMPLPRRSSMHRRRGRRPAVRVLTDLDAQLSGPARRSRPAGTARSRRSCERDVEDDEPAGLPLEPAVAVGEPALGRRQRALVLLGSVVDPDGGDRLRDLLAVGADVLHRRRAGRARDARQRLDRRPARARRCRRPGRPTARRPGRRARPPVALDPAAADGDDVAGPALVRRDHVGAAAEQQQRAAGLVGLADGGDEFVGVLDLDQPVDRAADGEGGEVRQPDVASNLHGPTLAGTTLRTGERAAAATTSAGHRCPRPRSARRPGWPPAGPAPWGCPRAERPTPTGCAGSTAGCSPPSSRGCATRPARSSSTSGTARRR